MKNIHILPTDQPSRLFKFANQLHLDTIPKEYYKKYQIYITSDEEIKEGDWYFITESISKCESKYEANDLTDICKKIILTTDGDLIADGVQKIDDEFLEWFVKNPTCEYAHIGFIAHSDIREYKIIIPQEKQKQHLINMMQDDEELGLYEEPKQETLEEAAEHNYPDGDVWTEEQAVIRRLAFKNGANWQAERMYTEADNIMRFLDTEVELKLSDTKTIERIKWYFKTYFEQFKKK